MNGVIVTCNAGSTNTKFGAFDSDTLKHTGKAVTHTIEETNKGSSGVLVGNFLV